MIQLPFKWHPAYGWLIGFVVCAVLVGSLSSLITSAIKDYRHDKIIEAGLIEREKDRKRADDAEARIPALEAQVSKQQIALELAGKDGQIAMEKVNEAQKKFQSEADSINAELDNCAQYNKLRASLKLPAVTCQ